MDSGKAAEQKSIECFLNCYVRETGEGKMEDGILHLPLKKQGAEIKAKLHYTSLTGRHLYSFPLFYRMKNQPDWIEADLVTLVSLLSKELSLTFEGQSIHMQEIMKRVLLSTENIRLFLEKRKTESSQLYDPVRSFLDSEQSLLFGHLLHPTPKSRQGMNEKETNQCSPETRGQFQLRYFLIHESIAEREGEEAEQAVLSLLTEEEKKASGGKPGFQLFPVHPLQAEKLLQTPAIQELMQEELLFDLGLMGRKVSATSSIRTVYNENLDYMFKFSIPVKVTNSLRVNKKIELERGLTVNKILDSEIGKQLSEFFPGFYVTRDPAYLAFKGEKESGLEVVIRENPFKKEKAAETTLIAGLCQDALPGEKPHIQRIMEDLAELEIRNVEEVSIDWFKKYLNISLQPLLWLYFTHGIALEAHQQNSVLKMDKGYPEAFYYRDNQGYYFASSKQDYLQQFVPNLKEKSDTVCEDSLVDERLRYYFFFNHIFGLINAFGCSGLVQEEKLLQMVREELENFIPVVSHSKSNILNTLLQQEALPCKANLLTRFHDMDELVGTLETQSVYTEVKNPLVQKEVRAVDYSHETNIV
ncbi:IucA/IucC family siderophore biosynthesis protein [Alteribacillus sp. YIM 98480]|uniref:IucA/IucC family protein n=1 Tax=Alteribacillus sp. YIM 98480 TaxID=2606599 RepID=UPI00131B2AA5|nr:IucA/IucC family protein [Alteribacillus sp. YIM 98480]